MRHEGFLLVHKPKHGQVPFFSFSKYLLQSTSPGGRLQQIRCCELGKCGLLQGMTVLSWFTSFCVNCGRAPDLHEDQGTFNASPSAAPDPLFFQGGGGAFTNKALLDLSSFGGSNPTCLKRKSYPNDVHFKELCKLMGFSFSITSYTCYSFCFYI